MTFQPAAALTTRLQGLVFTYFCVDILQVLKPLQLCQAAGFELSYWSLISLNFNPWLSLIITLLIGNFNSWLCLINYNKRELIQHFWKLKVLYNLKKKEKKTHTMHKYPVTQISCLIHTMRKYPVTQISGLQWFNSDADICK